MKTILALTLASLASGILAQELALPTAVIAPGDVEQGSIRIHRFSTNAFAVRFKYTEVGAQTMLDFRQKHAGQRVLIQVGKFESELQLAERDLGAPGGPDNRWLQHRADKIFCANEDQAKVIAEGMTKQ